MKTLWIHYATRFLRAFGASLLILALLVLVVETLLHLDDLLDAGPFGSALRGLLLDSLSSNLHYLLPVAAFTGALLVVGRAARAREMLAIRAAGLVPIVALLPILVIALPIGLSSLGLAESVGVRAARELVETSGLHAERIELRDGVVWYRSGRVIYSGRATGASGAQIRAVRVFERNASGRLLRSVQAARAERLSPEQWAFEDAVIRRFDPERPEAPPQITRAETITLALPSKRGLRLDKRELAALPLAALRSYAGELDAKGAGAVRVLLHSRLTLAAVALLFALFALALGLEAERQRSLALPALQGAGLLTGFLVLRERGAGIAFEIGGALWLLPWLLLAVFAALGALLLARAPR